ncbi:ricin-like [Mercurialis annua]|uniref:ricin-like n=1 Tax=Mercurialis annua TaxID=3986 RepID=UPI002160F325|nr:ricin-like [Mercurialis annua]
MSSKNKQSQLDKHKATINQENSLVKKWKFLRDTTENTEETSNADAETIIELRRLKIQNQQVSSMAKQQEQAVFSDKTKKIALAITAKHVAETCAKAQPPFETPTQTAVMHTNSKGHVLSHHHIPPAIPPSIRLGVRVVTARIPFGDSSLSLENNWGSLSEQIQTSNQGAFVRAVQLRQRDNRTFDVDSLTQALIRNMGLLLYFCTTPSSSNRRPRSATAYDVCDYSEPTVRIAGPNGLCADVYKGWMHNGNSIILWPCKTNTDANQLWTLKRDGTIQSNGKCLTTYGSIPGRYMMIYDCDSAVADATRWKVWDNGTIINPAYGLVLAAKTWVEGVTLTVETNDYSIGQSWRPTNNTQPFVASIVGFKDLCLHANGENVWVEECVASKKEQQWALYPDGSIRPQEKQQYCLTGDAELVKILSCKPGSSAQRWAFENDGSTLNLNTIWVLDVRRSDPSLKQILIYPNHGTKNQKWNVIY